MNHFVSIIAKENVCFSVVRHWSAWKVHTDTVNWCQSIPFVRFVNENLRIAARGFLQNPEVFVLSNKHFKHLRQFPVAYRLKDEIPSHAFIGRFVHVSIASNEINHAVVRSREVLRSWDVRTCKSTYINRHYVILVCRVHDNTCKCQCGVRKFVIFIDF